MDEQSTIPAGSPVDSMTKGMVVAAKSTRIQQAKARRELTDLVQQHQQGIISALPCSYFKPWHWSYRSEESLGDLPALAESIRSEGQIQQATVRAIVNPEEDGPKFEIISGYRRWRACQLIDQPLRFELVDWDDEACLRKMFQENDIRDGVIPLDEGRLFRRLLDERQFISLRKMAEALGKDKTYVSRCLSYTNLPAELVAAIEAHGKLSDVSLMMVADLESLSSTPESLNNLLPLVPDILNGKLSQRKLKAKMRSAETGREVPTQKWDFKGPSGIGEVLRMRFESNGTLRATIMQGIHEHLEAHEVESLGREIADVVVKFVTAKRNPNS